MPRNYTRKKTWGQTPLAEMESAAAEVMQGKKSLRKARRDRNIDKTTLKRFIKKKEKGKVKSVAWGAVAEAKRIFTDEMEEELTKHLKQLADQFHGLAPVKCRELAFEYAEKNNIPVSANWTEKQCAGWPFSNTMCKMSGFVQGVSVSASVFTLVAIAVERFRCIVYPLQPKPTVLVAKAAIIFIWVLAVGIMCPAAMALTVEKFPFHYLVYNDDFNHTLPVYSCYEDFENPKMRKVYTAVLFANVYLVPLTVITLMYTSIGVKLCSSMVANREPQLDNAVQVGGRRGGQPMILQKKIKVIKMLTLVALLFMLSWLPLWTLMMMTDYAGLNRDQLDLLTSYIFPFAHWLAFSNSSINPIIYGYYNENFRRGFQAVCKSRPLCCFIECQIGRRVSRLDRKGRSGLAACGGTDFREDNSNRNHLVLGPRNRFHNDNKVNDTAEVNRSARGQCEMVQSERNHSNQGLEMVPLPMKGSNKESERISSLAVTVYHAWEHSHR